VNTYRFSLLLDDAFSTSFDFEEIARGYVEQAFKEGCFFKVATLIDNLTQKPARVWTRESFEITKG
jgi:hypothetical protein